MRSFGPQPVFWSGAGHCLSIDWVTCFISKEILANALGLKLTGALSSDDDAILDNNDVAIENYDNENQEKENQENEN